MNEEEEIIEIEAEEAPPEHVPHHPSNEFATRKRGTVAGSRNASIIYAHDLFVFGDATGKRITNMHTLARTTGATVSSIYRAKTQDKWDEEVKFLAENRHIDAFEGISARKAVLKKSEILGKRLSDLEKEMDNLDISTDEGFSNFDIKMSLYLKVMDKWLRVSGGDAEIEANKNHRKELAKFQAKLDAANYAVKISNLQGFQGVESSPEGIPLK